MRIWVIEIGEPLPFQADQRLLRYGEFTRLLAKRGHEVTWWACDFSHQTRSYIGQPGQRIDCGGVSIVLTHGSGYRRNVDLRRFRHVKVHARNLAAALDAERAPDLILSAMPTVEASLVAARYASRHGLKLVVDIRDEWPEDYVRWVPRALRPFARLALAREFRALKEVCTQAHCITAVTQKQLDYGLRFAARPRKDEDRVFHTGAQVKPPEADAFAHEVEQLRVSAQLRADEFVCGYSGSLTASRPLGPVIQAVKQLSASIPIRLVIAGTGDSEPQYRSDAAGHPAVTFLGWQNAIQMKALYEVSDVLLAPYDPGLSFSLPTKIFDYMAAGRPLVSSCPGEAEELLQRHGFGVQVPHDSAEGIAAALLSLYREPETRKGMGSSGRRIFEENFAIDIILQRYAAHLESLAPTRGPTRDALGKK